MASVKTIIVGGFLGAGKTTLLAQAADLLAQRGRRVGLLTNDQAPDLVDTAYLKQQGFTVGEVCGGCFCCQFEKFLLASHQLLDDHAPEILLAEPVGSCTDISATVIQPLKKMAAHRFQVAPFSVVVDPLRLREAALGWLNASAELLSPSGAADWHAFAARLFERLQAEFRARKAEVAHLKILLTGFGGSLAVNLTSTAGEPSFRAEGKQARSFSAQMLVNARVQLEPGPLREVVENVLRAAEAEDIAVTLKNVECFSPARPKPTHRFTETVP